MGKGFQNFMSKKDFHPSAWWNLKRVWEAKQTKAQKEQKEEEMRVQYEKEQEMLNNKALLGDEKAKLGLSFMYEAPAGMAKREEPKEEPKFEWQRKYQAPREEWAKNNELIQDQPFGIQVRNVRCCKCHKWGHLNTDSECPLFGMSGNYDDAGYANNPSDLYKELRKGKQAGPAPKHKRPEDDDEWVDKAQLAEDMKESHGLRLKGSILRGIREDQQVESLKGPVSEAEQMKAFLATLSDKEKKKLMKKLMNGDVDKDEKKRMKKEKKRARKEKKKNKKKVSVKKEVESSASSSEDSEDEEKKRHVAVHVSKNSGVTVKQEPEDDYERHDNGHSSRRSPVARRRHDTESPDVQTRRRHDSPSPEPKTRRRHDTESPEPRARKRHDSSSPDVRDRRRQRSSSREDSGRKRRHSPDDRQKSSRRDRRSSRDARRSRSRSSSRDRHRHRDDRRKRARS